jgi:predicted nucleic acid-binding protein
MSLYIDANVLRNYCTGQAADIDCLNFLFDKRKPNRLFTSSLAVAQALSGFQKKKHISKDDVLRKGLFFNEKMTIIDFSDKDMLSSFEQSGIDVEDNMHYVLSKKKNCTVIVTNDKTGFSTFRDVVVVKPTKLGYLKNLIA